MKKFLTLLIITLFITTPVFSAADKTSEEYLKNNNVFAASFLGEGFVKSAIKHALKKEAPGKYKVKFKGYTLSSLKKGIFKYLEITGKDVLADDITIPYYNIKTVTDYNRIDYKQNPIVFKSDMELEWILHLSEESINTALKKDDYNKLLRKVNKKAFPLFTITGVNVRIKNNKLYMIISYNFPLAPKEKDRTFMISSGLDIKNNTISPNNISFDSAYGNLPLNKVTNLVYMINPMNFTTKLINNQKEDVRIETIKIVDDIVVINGKIFIKGEDK